ncbi:hypothetical protein [Staphylococcus equorum]|uniref:hypothetical protein n=1 Tax=Staphylococcus equorum TaxID=246432 RepID=UPI00192CFBBA|nr:hypothetical protein [Staphylococcus equorum]
MSLERLYTPIYVRNFFENYSEFITYVEKGDPSFIEVWVDINDALTDAELNVSESNLIYDYYLDNERAEVTCVDLSKKYGLSVQTAENRIKRALSKIVNELSSKYYDYHDIKIRSLKEDIER